MDTDEARRAWRQIILKSVKAAKASEIRKSLSKEDYWIFVQRAISSASELTSIVAESSSSLTVSNLGVILNYPITSTVELEFFVDGSDTRSIGVSVIAEGRYGPVLQEALVAISRECSLFATLGGRRLFLYSRSSHKSKS